VAFDLVITSPKQTILASAPIFSLFPTDGNRLHWGSDPGGILLAVFVILLSISRDKIPK
jgi:hypothetical protein